MNSQMEKPTKICELSFNISQWKIVCDKQISAEDWKKGEQYWSDNAKNWDDFRPDVAFLPAMKRRRLSSSARLFFEAAWELTDNAPNIPVVYASSNSEINRSFALWQTLLQEGDVSPTSFSLSVHNALIGQWSELRQVKQEMTAITALQDNLEVALVEANLLLNEGHQQVLVVLAEFPIEKQFNVQPVIRKPFAYTLAMLIEKGSEYQLSLQTGGNVEPVDNALFWVQHQHLASQRWQTASSRNGVWQWQKN